MPSPSAASYRMIASFTPPAAAPTMVARAVEMNSALPSPQPARNPMTASTLPAAPARPANTTTSTSPPSSVRLAPSLLETKLVTNMASPVISR